MEGAPRASASPTCRSSPGRSSTRSHEFPHLNATVGDDELVVHNYVDLGIAVDLDFKGLLVPVVRDAETKRLRAIAREISDLADRARSKQARPRRDHRRHVHDHQPGSAGTLLTMPIINQPQVAILSTDAHHAEAGRGRRARRQRGDRHPLGRQPGDGWDHRAFDGAYAAGFLVQGQGDPRDPGLGRRALT